MTAAGGPDWSALQAAIDGEVVLPQSARYDELSRPFNGRFEQLRPRAVARCASAQDVAETVAFIAREHLPSLSAAAGTASLNTPAPEE